MIVFRDGRPGRKDALPNNPAKKWRVRDPARTVAFAVHHTAGGDDPVGTAQYHVNPNHTSAEGMPGLAYTFYIRKSGEIWQAWDLEAQTWSQGGGKSNPDADGDGDVDGDDGLGRANEAFVGIVLGGSFRSRWNQGDQRPTFKQLLSLQILIGHLTGAVKSEDIPDELHGALGHLSTGDVWPHSAFGKAACPGEDAEQILLLMRATAGAASTRPQRTTADWQRALVSKGHDLGTWGPDRDGVDGHWGAASKSALVAFQRASGLPVTADRDIATELVLFR